MDSYLPSLASLQPWHWLVLGLLLLATEALGASGFLIGAALASLLMAIFLWFMPTADWGIQLILYGVGTLVMTVVWWKVFRRYNEQTDHPELNNRAAQLVDRVITLDQHVLNGQGHIQIGDTLWKVESDSDLTKGMTVVVSGYKGSTLLLTPREK